MDNMEITEKFVGLAKGKNWRELWAQKAALPDAEIRILFETVEAAGFEPKQVGFGQLRGDYLNEERRPTGETYAVNTICPFKVIGQNGSTDYQATGWLDAMVYLVVQGTFRDREQMIERVFQEIERSIPMDPIQLSLEGDIMIEYPPSRDGGYFVSHTRDTRALQSCVGIHEYCYGLIDRSGATKTHDALLCRHCHLRVLFPKNVKTYGELRQVMADRFKEKK